MLCCDGGLNCQEINKLGVDRIIFELIWPMTPALAVQSTFDSVGTQQVGPQYRCMRPLQRLKTLVSASGWSEEPFSCARSAPISIFT
jgi:hypothetical protein